MYRRETENHTGIFDGGPADVSFSSYYVVASQLHVGHYVARDASGDLCVRDAVLDYLPWILRNNPLGSPYLSPNIL